MRASLPILILSLLAAAGAALPPHPVGAQSLLDRSPNFSGGWVGLPGYFYGDLPHRFRDGDPGSGFDLTHSTTFLLAFGLPRDLLAGVAVAPSSDVVPGESDEWSVFGRLGVTREGRGAPLDLAVGVGYNGAAESLDGVVAAARWLGALRLLGEVRAMSSPYAGDGARLALGGGGVLHVKPGGLPVALVADVATLLDRDEGEDVAWSAGVHVGVPHTPYTFGIQASNTATTTIEGASLGGPTRLGFQLVAPVPVGELVGLATPREPAMRAVTEAAEGSDDVVRIPIRRYAFTPARIVVPAGTTVEWVNEDEVVHTATSQNGAWDSGAIRPGERWRARFDEAGRYPYLCAPHPYMQGMVVVR